MFYSFVSVCLPILLVLCLFKFYTFYHAKHVTPTYSHLIVGVTGREGISMKNILNEPIWL